MLAASPSGLIQILDPRQSYRQVSILSAPSSQTGGLSGLDVQGDTVMAWGWDVLQGQPVASSTISLFDLRTNRPLPSVNYEPGVGCAKINPSDASLVVVSLQGQVSVLDHDGNQTEVPDTHLDLESALTCMDLSPQGDYLALGESNGQVHLLTRHDISSTSSYISPTDGTMHLPPMNGHSGGLPIEWPNAPITSHLPPPDLRWTDRTPLNLVGMPWYDTPLLSNFTPTEYATASSPLLHSPTPIPHSVLSQMRVIDGVGYASLPRELKGKRNVVCRQASLNLVVDARGQVLPPGKLARGKQSRQKLVEDGPKFRSEKIRSGEESDTGSVSSLAGRVPLTQANGGSAADHTLEMPQYYRQVEIKYSRFGVEDFDFEFYNKTPFSGLETHIVNSYTNSLLQAYHYALPLRTFAKAHLTVDCPKEHCMLCEAGFLFRMLEDAQGINCQASNFSRAFTRTPQAKALGLLVMEQEEDPTHHSHGTNGRGKRDYAALIQKVNRWLTNTMAHEDSACPVMGKEAERGLQEKFDGLGLRDTTAPLAKGATPAPALSSSALSLVSQILAVKGQSVNVCSLCGHTTSKDFSAHVVDLVYPRKTSSGTGADGTMSASGGGSIGNQTGDARETFAAILQGSLIRETTAKATCGHCKKFTTLISKRRYRSTAAKASNEPNTIAAASAPLPPILSVNASLITDEHLDMWRDTKSTRQFLGRKRFLPERVRIRIGHGDGDVKVFDVNDSTEPEQPGDVHYVVRSLVASVQEDEHAEGHLVAFVNVPDEDKRKIDPSSTDAAGAGDNKWLLFNDFLVRPVGMEEALSFAGPWKIPAMVVLERVDSHDVLDLSALPRTIDPCILLKDKPISNRWNPSKTKHECLNREEIPQAGSLIAIDAEFIALQLEELEIRSDGTKNVLRPTKMSLARVSVVRGDDGPRQGQPFIDDYIHTSEPVVDYLFQFSGIREGDLDPSTSTHTLVPLKAAYKKLRVLVDLGCIFVGHGLPKDFRTINIFVPPAQVIDTVAIFYDPARHRKLSLRFLSWFLLKQEIQTAEHDSIEDARCALQLYKKYKTFVEENRFEDVMQDIFEAGKRLVS